MLQLNMIHLYKRKVSFLKIYTSDNNFEKKVYQDLLNIITRTDYWLTGYFRMTRLCYSQTFEDVCKASINVEEAYFLPSSNKALNIITLKTNLELIWNQLKTLDAQLKGDTQLGSYLDSYQN